MYSIKVEYLEALLKLSNLEFPNKIVIEEYLSGKRKAKEISVRALADLLKVDDWKKLVH